MEPTLSSINAFVSAWDAYSQAREELFGYGLSNTIFVPSMGWLQRAASATDRSVRRSDEDGLPRCSVSYRGINFVYQSSNSSPVTCQGHKEAACY